MSEEFVASKRQQRIFDEITNTNNSIQIIAKAGSGKSTTLVESLKLFPKNADVIFLAFNKSIADALKEKFPNKPKNITISTIHGFGANTLWIHLGKLPLNENKSFKTALSFYKQWKEDNVVKEIKWTYCDRVAQIVNLMKLTLTDPNEKEVTDLAMKYDIMFIGFEIEHAIEVYNHSLSDLKSIDFNDMIFLPAIKNYKMKKFDYVLIDEAQDLSQATQTIVKKIIKPRGRLISVGDDKQSVYGFCGADFEAFSKIKKIVPGTISLPLDVSYRCSKAVIKEAQKIVPDIKFHENAKQGVVRDGVISEIKDGNMVLCRNLKPLVILLLELVERGMKASIKGREIGNNIVRLIQKTKQTQVSALINHLKITKIELKNKLMKKGVFKPDSHNTMRILTEQIEIIIILARKAKTVKGIIDFISTIFLDKDFKGVILSTIHKAKGSENSVVFILCKELIPSQYATTKEQLQQERNLMYVAITRAKEKLIYITDYDDIVEEEE